MFDETGRDGPYRQGGARRSVQLASGRGDVVGDRLGRQYELGGNLPVRVTLGNQLDHVAFAWGQLGAVGAAPGPTGPAHSELTQPGLNGRDVGPGAQVDQGSVCGLELCDGLAA